jgi:hypothetical protein
MPVHGCKPSRGCSISGKATRTPCTSRAPQTTLIMDWQLWCFVPTKTHSLDRRDHRAHRLIEEGYRCACLIAAGVYDAVRRGLIQTARHDPQHVTYRAALDHVEPSVGKLCPNVFSSDHTARSLRYPPMLQTKAPSMGSASIHCPLLFFTCSRSISC